MKKTVALALSLLLFTTVFAGCGQKAEESKKGTNNVKVIDVDLTSEEYAFGVDKNQPELLQKVNDFVKTMKSDGTLEKICDKYFGDGQPEGVTPVKQDDSKDQLVVATNAAFEPFEYTKGDTYYGIDMEIAAALAKYLNKELVIQNMDFDAVCLSVDQKKCDIAMAGLTIKEDRKQYVTISEQYYNASQKLIVKTSDTEFDSCKEAKDIENILNGKDDKVKVGVQTGTTGQFYCEGDKEWGFDGYKMTTVGFKNGSLAVSDLLNGNVQYVIIDSAPAKCITEAINKLQ